MSLPTPAETVETLQTSLQAKAKAEPDFRFYSLWDKVCRKDILQEAYRRSRANAGAAGVDRVSFAQIEAQGMERWLERLQEELTAGQYAPKPLLRVWIPKSSGGRRPLGITVHLRPAGAGEVQPAGQPQDARRQRTSRPGCTVRPHQCQRGGGADRASAGDLGRHQEERAGRRFQERRPRLEACLQPAAG